MRYIVCLLIYDVYCAGYMIYQYNYTSSAYKTRNRTEVNQLVCHFCSFRLRLHTVCGVIGVD